MTESYLRHLFIADPELAETVRTGLQQKKRPISSQMVSLIVDETLWGLSMEISFGQAIAMGFLALIEVVEKEKLDQYRNFVREAGKTGPTLGKFMATFLVPVFIYGDKSLIKLFLETVNTMAKKGTYTLTKAFEVLSTILAEGDLKSGNGYLNLLYDTFSQDLTYSQSQHLSTVLPKTILMLSPENRNWQIQQIARVIGTDVQLADDFLDGFEKGLHLLSEDALKRFVSSGLERFAHKRRLGAYFLSLNSRTGMDTFLDLQSTVPISQVLKRLNQYLKARTGLDVSARPLSELPKTFFENKQTMPYAVSDGKHIYLPKEIGISQNKADNVALYKCLARLESGLYEFHTFDFDLEKAIQRCRRIDSVFHFDEVKRADDRHLSDMERFFTCFPQQPLASDLFTLFEHGRIRILLDRHYPGILRNSLPLLQRESVRIFHEENQVEILFLLYLRIALGISSFNGFDSNDEINKRLQSFSDLFAESMRDSTDVETCAQLVAHTYTGIEALIKDDIGEGRYRPMKTPFGRRLRPDLFFMSRLKYERLAESLKRKLAEKGYRVYKSEIKRHLVQQRGSITEEDIVSILLDSENTRKADEVHDHPTEIDLSWLDLSEFGMDAKIFEPEGDDTAGIPVSRYREWDNILGDYLNDHVMVRDRILIQERDDFYQNILERHRGLVKRIRYSFELLKPEALTLLRPWLEGDEFDYRAILDFAIDKKGGRIPSDRLYIKRLKQQRDVAVLLLVDLSRSTANRVYGSELTVLDVEKEAIVLLCEALEVLGDTYAIGGFSGTGRLGVDYFKIKGFDEGMSETVRHRISGMEPQRNTRMGAAIRHATRRIEQMPAKVRLMIILGDGFPNDINYKKDYAMEDTRMAIFEARSKNIFTHTVTVNVTGGSQLDAVYGHVGHTVISDVRELPDKLLKIYSKLTR